MTKEHIQDWLITAFARVLEIAPEELDTSIPFERYGIDSAFAVQLTGDLEKLLGRSLSPTLLYDYPSIDLLSAHLA
ncbi:acyl carrier protein [Pendulispora brunnea]|uniref:Acyl carrier protein n=1 Tax=Pendulispora brunnea TaxID=2905690 RepID=A0ABZ2JY45_9BACT